jgi:hypothetical protein
VYFACLPFKAKDASHPQKTRPIQTLGSAVRLEYPLARGVAVSAETLPQFQSRPAPRFPRSLHHPRSQPASQQRLPRLPPVAHGRIRPSPGLPRSGSPRASLPGRFGCPYAWVAPSRALLRWPLKPVRRAVLPVWPGLALLWTVAGVTHSSAPLFSARCRRNPLAGRGKIP